MSRITAICTPVNQTKLTNLLNMYAAELNSLGPYNATVTGSNLDLHPVSAPVHFLRVSPSARAGAVADFCTFVGQNPPKMMVDAYARHANPPLGKPGNAFKTDLAGRLADPTRSLPDKLQVLQSALAQVHRDWLPDVFENVVLPWYFALYPDGRVIAATQTAASEMVASRSSWETAGPASGKAD